MQEADSEDAGKHAQPQRKEGQNVSHKAEVMTDQDIMACTSPEQVWKKISNKASEGRQPSPNDFSLTLRQRLLGL